MRYIKKFALSLILSFMVTGYSFAQAELDVLPAVSADNIKKNELFHQYLMDELAKTTAERQAAYDAALASVPTFEAYQAQLKADYLKILGDFPEKNALNAVTVKTIDQSANGYKIELVSYESMPNHHVVANLYTPSTAGKYPGVIVPCGHYGIPNIKAWDYYQRVGIAFAQNGFVALVIDPVASGERAQLVNPSNGDLAFKSNSGTSTHSRLAVGSHLVGTSVPAYQVWDNVRGIDYLLTRSDVDPDKIGVTGSSGGGAQTMFLIGYDSRIKVAGIVSGMTTVTSMWANGGPQDGCQNLAHEGLYHIDQQDFVTMISPIPSMILQGSQDALFLSAGAESGYLDAKKSYDLLNESSKIGFFNGDEDHGFRLLKRQEALRWFKTWFYNDNSAVVEPTSYDGLILSYDDLAVTTSGQIMTEYPNEKNITELNLDLADGFAQDRTDFWTNNSADVALAKVKDLIKLKEDYEAPTVSNEGTLTRENYTIDKLIISSGDNTPLPALYIKPNNATGKMPAVLYVDGLGKRTDAAEGKFIERFYADSGYVAMTVDLRGFGETRDDGSRNESKHNNIEHRNSVISEYIGKSLIGQRVEDIMIAMDVLLAQDNVDPTKVTIIGLNRAVTAVLHAAALDGRFADVKLWDFDYQSYREIVAAPLDKDNMTHVVIGALKYYDLPDLVSAIGSTKVEIGEKPAIPDKPVVEPLSVSNTFDNIFNLSIFPNPADESTVISYLLNEEAFVKLSIYDLSGSKVAVLVNQRQGIGAYSIPLSNGTLKNGIYITRLQVEGYAPFNTKVIISK